MLANLIRWSMDNRIFILVLTGFLTIWGLMSLKKIPLDALPDLSDVQIIVHSSCGLIFLLLPCSCFVGICIHILFYAI